MKQESGTTLESRLFDLVEACCNCWSLVSPGLKKKEKEVEIKMSEIIVGAQVRIRLPDQPKIARRGVVATQQDGTCCVLLDDEAPVPLKSSFIVCPKLEPSTEEAEITLKTNDVLPLLPFEAEKLSSRRMQDWKDFGDQLLRLGDAAAAVPFYEMALRLSSSLQVGCSVLVRDGGHVRLAEVDCLDGDSVDIVVTTSGEEKTIAIKEILLCVLSPSQDRLQERILLNLGRCLLQLAETTRGEIKRRPLFLKSAVLACTLCLEVAAAQEEGSKVTPASSSSSISFTALLLRSKAQASLSKFPHAIADAKRLLSLKPDHKEGKAWLRELEREQAQYAKRDKKLVKEMSKWIQSATNDSVSEREETDVCRPAETYRQSQPVVNYSYIWVSCFLVLLFAWLLRGF